MRRLTRCGLLVCTALNTVSAQRRELTPHEQSVHVLSRLAFGARPGDLERVSAMGVDRWIAEQLRPATIADDALNVALTSLSTWTMSVAELGSLSAFMHMGDVTVRYTDSAGAQLTGADTLRATGLSIGMRSPRMSTAAGGVGAPAVQFAAGKVLHAHLSERQLEEVIADFWENHFSVYSQKTPSAGSIPAYVRGAIRPHALGKFRDLLGAVAHHSAMLFYLDNHLSTARGINENYARELLELHTLGVDGGYTQADVVDVARALTGWSFDPPPRSVPFFAVGARFMFRAEMHDSTEKTVLGAHLAPGRGVEDGEQVLDILARHPSTARFISYKLARRLVSDAPPKSVIDRAAETFTRTDGDLAEVVRAIVTSDEFFARAAFRAKVKSPFEFVVSARRAMNAPGDTTGLTVQLLRTLGQAPFGRQSPDGWPDNAKAWLTAGAMHQRFTIASEIARGELGHFQVAQWEGWQLATRSVDQQIDGVIRLVLGGVCEPATRESLRRTGEEKFTADAPEGVGMERLRALVAVTLASPDFQKR